VDFFNYIPALVDDLFETYKISPQDIELEVEVSDGLLDLDQAVPCGLMLNELISNSLKYAFPNGCKGKMSVQLGPNKEGDTRLVVQDNGIGLPEGFDYRKSKSLGLQLIGILSRQLQGGFELRSEAGPESAITFPVRSGPMGDWL
jgi:two-component sensor histidine kinase